MVIQHGDLWCVSRWLAKFTHSECWQHAIWRELHRVWWAGLLVCVSPDQPQSIENTTAIATNLTSSTTNANNISKYLRHHIQIPISAEYLANSNQLLIPVNKTNITVYLGNGLDYTAQNGGQAANPGYHCVLPQDPDEATRIEVITHLDKNSSAADEVIVVQFPGPNYSGPANRKFVDHFGAETLASSSVSLSCASNVYSTRAWIFTYTEVDHSDGAWCVVQHTN